MLRMLSTFKYFHVLLKSDHQKRKKKIIYYDRFKCNFFQVRLGCRLDFIFFRAF